MRNRKHALAALLALATVCALSGCMRDRQEGPAWELMGEAQKPKLPEKLEVEDGLPVLSVYDTADEDVKRMDIEAYVAGVVAGEMKNDWPEEALKAQAILARTFVLKFCQDKYSRYEDADISTDVAEAQAYAPDSVNGRVRLAVEATRGKVMAVDGEFPYAWFHAHSGGMTELPSAALDFSGDDPGYLRPVKSEESDKAPDGVKRWKASFSREEVARACTAAGTRTDGARTVEIGEKGESGRAKTLLINGAAVSAPSFRIQIGAERLKSTLIDSVTVEGDAVTFAGRGYGHGVGMSQWGAYGMAEQGKTAEEIIGHYFPGVEIIALW